ncbi:DeoR/GlpR family DNA-binding transcription regulator [Opitutus sp. GAS368]|uniref:DeoR/GlpR family DNA-binding transcription regulator n=1 Tax=Opitutus sp. GAS368 TaxID=1882749 RepID=UPI00087B72F5|nr:DeoR/GlpR family DNA-binding transcription regulator [Opitutus sp. GAS368]SDS36207.1 transcriptional regulator, DeoR family [Opitutus sp. GAS368]
MRVPQHIVDLRREELRSLIRRDGFLPVNEICRRLGVSEATARRDLVAVEANGHITRTYGGALADYNSAFASHDERSGRARPAKARIAGRAVAQMPRTGTIFLDAGTTIQATARALTQRKDLSGLVVVTNSLAAASVLGGTAGVELHVVGGEFLSRQAALMGPRAIKALGDWSFDAAFLGGEGMDAAGISNSHASVAAFQQSVLRRAQQVYFCLDASKLGRATPHRVADWSRPSALISDAPPKRLAAHGIVLPPSKLLRA